MTLGRSPSGAIKIKTDEEGGGLRAVNCACCVPLVCGCMIPSDNLKLTIESATQVAVTYGSVGSSQPWDGTYAFFEGPVDGDFLLWYVSYSNGILCIGADSLLEGTVKIAPEPFTAEECWIPVEFTPVITDDGSINGQPVRVAHAFEDLISPLTIVFT